MKIILKIKDEETFNQMLKNKSIIFAKAIVDGIRKNINSKRKNINIVKIEFEDNSYIDINVEKKDFISTLKTNLQHFEREELYEECTKINELISTIENI
jgi:hypothetical protein